MLRKMCALFAAVFAVAVVSSVFAEDKPAAEKKLEGKLVCTKCTLKETKACGHALLVKEGDKEVTYYISDKGGKEGYHPDVCPAGTKLEATVTGKVSEKDGKKTITDAKVELKK